MFTRSLKVRVKKFKFRRGIGKKINYYRA